MTACLILSSPFIVSQIDAAPVGSIKIHSGSNINHDGVITDPTKQHLQEDILSIRTLKCSKNNTLVGLPHILDCTLLDNNRAVVLELIQDKPNRGKLVVFDSRASRSSDNSLHFDKSSSWTDLKATLKFFNDEPSTKRLNFDTAKLVNKRIVAAFSDASNNMGVRIINKSHLKNHGVSFKAVSNFPETLRKATKVQCCFLEGEKVLVVSQWRSNIYTAVLDTKTKTFSNVRKLPTPSQAFDLQGLSITGSKTALLALKGNKDKKPYYAKWKKNSLKSAVKISDDTITDLEILTTLSNEVTAVYLTSGNKLNTVFDLTSDNPTTGTFPTAVSTVLSSAINQIGTLAISVTQSTGEIILLSAKKSSNLRKVTTLSKEKASIDIISHDTVSNSIATSSHKTIVHHRKISSGVGLFSIFVDPKSSYLSPKNRTLLKIKGRRVVTAKTSTSRPPLTLGNVFSKPTVKRQIRKARLSSSSANRGTNVTFSTEMSMLSSNPNELVAVQKFEVLSDDEEDPL